jgi:cytosine/creatinine deaminase
VVLLLRNARVSDARGLCDIVIDAARIRSIQPAADDGATPSARAFSQVPGSPGRPVNEVVEQGSAARICGGEPDGATPSARAFSHVPGSPGRPVNEVVEVMEAGGVHVSGLVVEAVVIDVGGRVVIPGLVEPHIHLDKALLTGRVRNRSGTLAEALHATRQAKASFTRQDIRNRATKALEMCLCHGVTSLRAQTEFDPEIGLIGIEVLLELKAAYAELVDIQVVAFPQEGIYKPGAHAMLDLFRAALSMGADVVGGVPYVDVDAEGHIDACFALARKYGKPLSFHQDFADGAERLSIEYLARKTIAEGMQSRVEIGHATGLGALPPDKLQRICGLLREADISVITLPLTDLHLGGRSDPYNVRRALAPVKALLDAGVNVAAGANNVRNAFTPFGTGDPLLTALLLVPAAHLGGEDMLPRAVDLVTINAARAIGCADGYAIEPGGRASLVVPDTRSLADAVIDLPDRTHVLKDGRLTFTSERTIRAHVQPNMAMGSAP